MYQLTEDTNIVIRLADGACIPLPPQESEGFRYAEWLAAGNTPLPVPTVSIDARRAAVWERVKALRTQYEFDGAVLAAGHWFHTDAPSRQRYDRLDARAAAALAGGASADDEMSLPEGPIAWTTFDNYYVVMTYGLVQQIAAAVESLDYQLYAHAGALRVQIAQSEEPESLDVEGGWPANRLAG